MKCHYCGAEVPEKANFCRNCGTRQDRQAAPAVQAPPVIQEEPVMKITPHPFASVDMENLPRVEPGVLPRVEQLPTPMPVPTFDEQSFSWVPAGQTSPEQEFPEIPVSKSPRIQLPVRRGLGKMFFLGILTLGIYPVVIWSRIVTELNLAASRSDGKRTMPFFAMTVLAPVTLGIYLLVWMHKFCGRIGAELQRRNLDYQFGAAAFWLWNVLGSLILVGPFIFLHKLMKAMNKINSDFNIYG